MAGSSGHWLLMASLMGILGTPIPVLAQAGRTWIDPPAESGTKSPTPAPAVQQQQAPAPAAALPPAQLSSSPASTQAPKDKESAEAKALSVASPRREESRQQVKE